MKGKKEVIKRGSKRREREETRKKGEVRRTGEKEKKKDVKKSEILK